jgi:hypothetical protein
MDFPSRAPVPATTAPGVESEAFKPSERCSFARNASPRGRHRRRSHPASRPGARRLPGISGDDCRRLGGAVAGIFGRMAARGSRAVGGVFRRNGCRRLGERCRRLRRNGCRLFGRLPAPSGDGLPASGRCGPLVETNPYSGNAGAVATVRIGGSSSERPERHGPKDPVETVVGRRHCSCERRPGAQRPSPAMDLLPPGAARRATGRGRRKRSGSGRLPPPAAALPIAVPMAVPALKALAGCDAARHERVLVR